MLFMSLFQVMEFHCLSGALATGSTYIFSALWFFPLNCTNHYIWASALETFYSAFILQLKPFMKGRINMFFWANNWGEKAQRVQRQWGNKTWSSQIINQCICSDLVYLCWLVLGDEWIQNFPPSPSPAVAAPHSHHLNLCLGLLDTCGFLGRPGCEVMRESLLALLLHSYTQLLSL